MLTPLQLDLQARERVTQLRVQADSQRRAPFATTGAAAARWLHAVADRLEAPPSPGRAIARERGVAS